MSITYKLQPPARTDRLSDQVAEQLEQLVVTRALQPGEKIPSERELCEKLGVSRTVVREAVRSLVVKGLLDVRQGGGTVVCSPDMTLVTKLMTTMLRTSASEAAFSHMQEVRRLLEIEIAGLAAERRTDEDIARLEEQIRAMQVHERDQELWSVADVAFHSAIAQATHNPLYPLLLSSIADMLIEVRRQASHLPETPQLAEHHHRAILENIRSRNREGARNAMEEHLREAEDTFQRARLALSSSDDATTSR
jgi:GntR family transcriptional regulator, transcriptional repressor for pyruvate dehydrogenase complex